MKKFRKVKIFLAIVMSLFCFAFVSCGEVEVEGGDLIEKAREDYTSLDSARVIMTNTETNQQEQEFVFKYDEKDVLIFSYYGKDGKDEYAIYNDGMSQDIYQKGEYKHQTSDDKEFQKYVRNSTYPQADKGMIIYQPESVENAQVKEDNGVTHIIHEYDVKKIANSDNKDSLKSFTADYYFDKDGKLLYFVESSTMEKDGKEENYSYRIDITEKNEVKSVENMAEKFKK